MRISVVFEGSCETLHISPHHTVASIRKMIEQRFWVQLYKADQQQGFLELRHAGAALQDSWCVADMGITAGSRISCQVKEVRKAVLHVFSAITKKTLPLTGPLTLLSSRVSELKVLVSLKLGIPVGAFRLSTASGLPLYACNLLSDYSLTAGDTLHLDTWNGWSEFLRACLRGHQHTVQRFLSEEKSVLRFQKRVALYVSAAHGYLDMASWLINSGVRAEDPVGVHPYRTWCSQTEHPDSFKCPAHAAAEAGQLLILKLFVSSSVANLACRDPSGRNVLRIAIKHRHKECVNYLVSKLYTTVNFPGCSLPMSIYLQIKTWIHKARRARGPFGVRIGDTVQVDGFPTHTTSSNPKGRAARGRPEVKGSSCGFAMTSFFVGPSCLSHHPAAPPSQNASMKLPQLHPPQTQKSTRPEKHLSRNRACGRKSPKEILRAENSDGSLESWRSKAPLPCLYPDSRPRHFFIHTSPKASQILTVPMETFQLLCGRTFRENAIYCLAIASAFTEKPWLQQLAVAQTLARRSIQNIL